MLSGFWSYLFFVVIVAGCLCLLFSVVWLIHASVSDMSGLEFLFVIAFSIGVTLMITSIVVPLQVMIGFPLFVLIRSVWRRIDPGEDRVFEISAMATIPSFFVSSYVLMYLNSLRMTPTSIAVDPFYLGLIGVGGAAIVGWPAARWVKSHV